MKATQECEQVTNNTSERKMTLPKSLVAAFSLQNLKMKQDSRTSPKCESDGTGWAQGTKQLRSLWLMKHQKALQNGHQRVLRPRAAGLSKNAERTQSLKETPEA